jgi:hypothetical protein
VDASADADHLTLRNALPLLSLALQILHLRIDATAGELKPELLATAGSEQVVHIHPGEPDQQQQRRAVWTKAVAHIGALHQKTVDR